MWFSLTKTKIANNENSKNLLTTTKTKQRYTDCLHTIQSPRCPATTKWLSQTEKLKVVCKVQKMAQNTTRSATQCGKSPLLKVNVKFHCQVGTENAKLAMANDNFYYPRTDFWKISNWLVWQQKYKLATLLHVYIRNELTRHCAALSGQWSNHL